MAGTSAEVAALKLASARLLAAAKQFEISVQIMARGNVTPAEQAAIDAAVKERNAAQRAVNKALRAASKALR